MVSAPTFFRECIIKMKGCRIDTIASSRIAENERVGRVIAFCSHQPDLCCFQKWLAVVADPATQVRVPRREFWSGVTQATFAKSFFEQWSNCQLILMFVVFGTHSKSIVSSGLLD